MPASNIDYGFFVTSILNCKHDPESRVKNMGLLWLKSVTKLSSALLLLDYSELPDIVFFIYK